MNFRLRDKSKAKIRNYQINFAASLQIPSPNRKITDRNRPSNSPPPRSLATTAISFPIALSRPLLSRSILSRPVLSCRPLRPVPDQTVFASEATTTHTPIRPALVLPSSPRGPFPEVEPRAGIGSCRNRILAARFAPARNPIRHTTPHHTPHDRSTDRIQQNTPAGNSGRGILSIPKSSRGREST